MGAAAADGGSIAEMNDVGFAAAWAVVGAAITGLFAWLVQRSKGDTDVEVAALAEWQKLYNALSTRLADVERELAECRADYAARIEQMEARHGADMRARDAMIEGLQRTIIQNSRMTPQLISASPVTNPKDAPDGK